MPPFPERESSILAKLKKKKGPGAVSVNELEDAKREGGELNGGGERGADTSAMAASNAVRVRDKSTDRVHISIHRSPEHTYAMLYRSTIHIWLKGVLNSIKSISSLVPSP